MTSNTISSIGSGHVAKGADNVYRTDRYDIHVRADEVQIFDRQSGEWVKVWGDPHVVTSDGDKAGFQEGNVTLDLPDGTKVTVVPTEQGANGTAFVDKVIITNGTAGAEVTGVHDSSGPRFGNVGNDARGLDSRYADGTVLHADQGIDDLFYLDAGGKRTELKGAKEGARFDEHDIANLGGTATSLSIAKAMAGEHADEFQLMHNNEAQMDWIDTAIRTGKWPAGGVNPLTGEAIGGNGGTALSDTDRMELLSKRSDLHEQNMLVFQQLTAELRSLYEAMKQIIENMRA